MNIFGHKNIARILANRQLSKLGVGFISAFFSLAICSVQAAAPAQEPLFLSIGAKPHIALVMSVDHELYKKAYTDYANLDGNSLTMTDTTYRDDFDYYGYFDSDWCYSYSDNTTTPGSSFFTPHSKSTAPASGVGATKTHHCVGTANDTWSGNFLNWLSMSRIDIVRRVLFGGKRSVDTASQTILERAYLPKDVHAFAKTYGGATQDISPYTPTTFSSGSSYTFCNVSTSETGYPIIRAARGDWPLWATVESGGNALNGNASGNCSLAANNNTLVPTGVQKDYTAKVEACVTNKNATVTVNGVESPSIRCRKYGSNYKPGGLLQKYGESGTINFSLMSGSYKANIKGGVLRKAASPLVSSPANNSVDEINTSTGQFNDVPGIIKNISNFRIASYQFSSKTYADCNRWSISIDTVKAGTDAGKRCRDWGNPLSEIYLETLRYIAGLSATSAFVVDDSTAEGSYPGISALSKANWNDPWPADQYCAKCSIIVLSTGSNSFDGDDLAGVANLPGMSVANLNTKTNYVGEQEYGAFGTGKEFFMGGTDAKSRYCKSFSIAGLSNYTGICPELPALEGGYHIAGLANYARTTDLRPSLSNGPNGIFTQKVNTYAVDLAETVPSFPIAIGGNSIQFLPACESNVGGSAVDETAPDPWSTCSLFNVKIHSLTYNASNALVKGSMSFYWEDSLWGYDYDLDVEQRLDFCVGPTADGCNDNTVGANEIRITNTIPYAEAGNALRLSYSIYGVSSFKGTWRRNSTTTTINTTAFSGGLVSPWMLRPGGQNYSSNPPASVGTSTFTFTAGSSAVTLPKKPLFLAAKYGGYIDLKKNDTTNAALVDDVLDYVKEWDNYQGRQDAIPDNFFGVKNPSLLEESLDTIFTNILRRTSSASAVATSSTRLQQGQFVYQAVFDSSNWSGEVRSYAIDSQGALPSAPTITTRSANTMPTSGSGRQIFTYKSDGTVGSTGETVRFEWANLHSSQQTNLALTGDPAGMAQKRLNWLQGNATDEGPNGLRSRDYEDASGSSYRNILGDVVNSSPAFVGSTNYRFYGLSSALGGETYADFVQWKKGLKSLTGYPSAPAPRLFVGSNDGMVHAFNADNLREIFAYVPRLSFHKLAKLAERDYGSSANKHQYLVDGPIVTGDAYISTPSDSTKKWRSIVVGTFGAGAKGIYALDVTNENTPEVLFEYSHADMGYILGRPTIAPTADGRWVVITGNGLDTGATSKLFVIDLEQPYGSRTKILNTAAGTGLSAPSVVADNRGVAKSVYAGDLSGNMWRFNIDNASSSSWSFYKVYAACTSSSACNTSSIYQAIVAAPTVGYNPKLNKNMVYFGTGKYHDDIDKSVGGVRHSFYAVPDMGASGTMANRSNLLQKTMTTSYSGTASRTVSTTSPDWTTKTGWYIDLDYDTTAKRDERVTIKAVLLQDVLYITTLIPSDASCLPGGSSWLMAVTAVGGIYDPPPPYPDPKLSEELFLGEATPVLITAVKTLNASASSTSVSASSAANECGDDLNGALATSGTSGAKPELKSISLKACQIGRQAWRQLK